MQYQFSGSEQCITPALVFYPDQILENTRRAIAMAGSAERLWPHMKTHKCPQVLKLLRELGISRCKCATIAEAEVAAQAGYSDILLAYPLIGPNIARFLSLQIAFPGQRFWAIGDDLGQLKDLGEASLATGIRTRLLIDADLGMHRTGVPLDGLEAFYRSAAKLPGLALCGLHCYDGHRTEANLQERLQLAQPIREQIFALRDRLTADGFDCSVLIMGGTPSFPCYLPYPDVFLSPGTLFINDCGYGNTYRDLPFAPAAALLTRVVSCPQPGLFTLDLGYKGISPDHAERGEIVGMEQIADPVAQSEEHWVFRMKPGYEGQCPKVGDELFVIPNHVCPTVALYPEALVVQSGRLTDCWPITARIRKLTY